MKFLLVAVNAKYIHSNPAIYSLYAYAEEKYGQMIEIAEYTINQKTEDILAQIFERQPDIIGFSCYIWNWNVISELLSNVSKILPDTDIWLGGPQVSYNAPEVLKEFPNVKGIMVGEGEMTFCDLLEKYENGDTEDFAMVPGLCLHDGYTAPREITDLSKLPFLYHDMKPFTNRIIYYESSRGCPYRCSYCLSSIDKKVRLRDMELVKKELEFFLSNNVKQVKFVDRTFNCVHDHAMAIWQYLYDHDNGVTNFHFEISADIINEEEIKLLNKFRPGHVQLEIGVQSTNEKTLEAINRKMNLERLEHVVAKIKKGHNIHQHLDLIAGLPYEDYESFRNSFNRVYAMRPDQLQLGFLKVLSGAPIAERTEEFGIAYTKQPPYEVLYTKWLSYSDVIRLKKIEEMVELYYNSDQFEHTLEYLVKAFDSPFTMYEALADFYEKNGYFTNSPSRAYRYEVLLNFAIEYDKNSNGSSKQRAEDPNREEERDAWENSVSDGQKKEIYVELLTYDLYLRENMKSRPEFCKDLSDATYKDFRHAFYKEEEKTRQYLPNLSQYDARQLAGMTHLECFEYPVWDPERLVAGERDPKYLLFDYSEKNPLTKEAHTTIL